MTLQLQKISLSVMDYKKTGLPDVAKLRKAFALAQNDAQAIAAGGMENFTRWTVPLAQRLARHAGPAHAVDAAALGLLFQCYRNECPRRDFAAEFDTAAARDLAQILALHSRALATRTTITPDEQRALSIPARSMMLGSLLLLMERELEVKTPDDDTTKNWQWLLVCSARARNLMPTDSHLDLFAVEIFEKAAAQLGQDVRFYFSPAGQLSLEAAPPPSVHIPHPPFSRLS